MSAYQQRKKEAKLNYNMENIRNTINLLPHIRYFRWLVSLKKKIYLLTFVFVLDTYNLISTVLMFYPSAQINKPFKCK